LAESRCCWLKLNAPDLTAHLRWIMSERQTDAPYVSDLGWTMELPPGWQPMMRGQHTANMSKSWAVVFAAPDGWSLSLSWMAGAHPVDDATVISFRYLTSAIGPITNFDTEEVLKPIFPSLGEIERAAVLELRDGAKAVDIFESISAAGHWEQRKGYQMILPIDLPGESTYFQRLCFYAPARAFARLIPEVYQSIRTFHYIRRFGLDEETSLRQQIPIPQRGFPAQLARAYSSLL